MKNITSKIIKTIGVWCTILGAIILVIGLCLFPHDKKVDVSGDWEHKESSFPATAETNFILDTENSEVIVQTANVSTITISYDERIGNPYTISLDGNTIEMKQEQSTEWFSLGWNDSGKVVITLPQSGFGTINLNTSNAQINITGVTCEELIADSSNSSINLESVLANGDISLDTSNAHVSTSNVMGNSVSIDTSNSSVTLRNTIAVDTVGVKTSNGSIRAEDIFGAEKIVLETSNGKIEASIRANPSQLDVTCSTSNGKCDVPTKRGPTIVYADTSNADVTITTTEE